MSSFGRMWKQLLLKYNLSSVRARDWHTIVKDSGWDAEQAKTALNSFHNVIASQGLLGIAVAVDTRMWHKLKGQMRNLAIGSAEEFAFQRLIRLLLDRLESSGHCAPLNLVFDADPRDLARRTGSVRLMYQLEDRAAHCIPNIQFLSSERQSHLQAAGLLAHFVRNNLIDSAGSGQPLKNLRALPEGPGMPVAAIFEFWDQQYARKWLQSLEVHSRASESAPKRPRSKRSKN